MQTFQPTGWDYHTWSLVDSTIASSSRNVLHGLTDSGTSATSFGQPLLMISDNYCKSLSRSVSFCIVIYSESVTLQSLTGSSRTVDTETRVFVVETRVLVQLVLQAVHSYLCDVITNQQ